VLYHSISFLYRTDISYLYPTYIRMLVEKVPSPALSGTWFVALPTLPSSTSTSPSLSTSATVIEYVDALPVA
jgi:hypothetical protein